jgi:hypothetical protein
VHDFSPATSTSQSESSSEIAEPGASAPVGSALQAKADGSIPPALPGGDAGNGTPPSASDKAYGRVVQMKDGGPSSARSHQIAASGVAGSGGTLPFVDKIQASFGSFDVSGISAHTGAAAASAAAGLGAKAYATGNDVAFAGAPDLHTAAHEAAHVVQQRAGVHLAGGIGAAGDAYENHADAVADKVVRGESAQALLSTMAGPSAGSSTAVQSKAVQLLGHGMRPQDALRYLAIRTPDPSTGRPVYPPRMPEGVIWPEYGETSDQRQYSPAQYIELWEKEQGRKMTEVERETIARGCIGVVATNIEGWGNPLDFAESIYDDFDVAHKEVVEKNQALTADGHDGGKGGYILFAKLFWSNQSPDWEARKKPDPKAFLGDPKTHRVDMTGYEYEPQSRMEDGEKSSYINFDYGFWDESTQSFWHANHGYDSSIEKKNPAMIYQSTREHFTDGYIDFDRIIFCVARCNNYDPRKAAETHSGGR